VILGIRTDKPEAELYLLGNGKILETYKWQAHRQLADTIHLKVNKILQKQGIGLEGLSGLVVFKGPGSFTGLRIGISVANTLAYSLNLPIVGVDGEKWLHDGANLLKAKNHKIVLPEYGALPNITKPKK
jgi:tRNA threonylcarbamoyladenosine biosynthesis protein TsaB